MTIKQQRVVQEIVGNGGNVGKAMRAAGYSESMANNPQKLKAMPEVQDALQALLKDKGITLDKALQPIADGLEAKKLIVHGKNSEEGWTEDVPDHQVRLASSDRALKLLNITSDKQPTYNNKELSEAIRDNVDEVQLTQAVFRKKEV